MASLPSRIPASGRVLLAAEVNAHADHVDAIRDQLKAVRDFSVSDKEPGCLTYRIGQNLDQPTTFRIFEEYAGKEAVEEHFKGAAFKQLGKLIEEGKGSIKFITFDEEL